jgi:hypothetical protein
MTGRPGKQMNFLRVEEGPYEDGAAGANADEIYSGDRLLTGRLIQRGGTERPMERSVS